jgi:hypothetical protein
MKRKKKLYLWLLEIIKVRIRFHNYSRQTKE